jgi:hypothetical protein
MHSAILQGMLTQIYKLYTKNYIVYVWYAHPHCIHFDMERKYDLLS